MTHPWSQTLTALANLMDATETVKALGETMTFGPDIDPFPPRIYGDNKLDLARVKWALENARSLEMPFRVLAAETKEKMRLSAIEAHRVRREKTSTTSEG